MKLTKKTLKGLIKEVLKEKSMILSEVDEPIAPSDNYSKIIAILEGRSGAKTVGIMSGQNPMAQSTSPEQNSALASKLKGSLSQMGLSYEEIGGVFEGHPEDSVIVLNPSLEQMEQLNRMYTQWGFVWGENLPTFTMYQVDYKKEAGIYKAPGSKVVNQVLKHDEIGHVEDNYSYDKQTGKKFVIPLYGVPE